jgi:hypothetical protein
VTPPSGAGIGVRASPEPVGRADRSWRGAAVLRSVQDRWQIGAGRLVVEAGRHQRCLLYEPQSLFKTPAEQIVVARRQQKPRSTKRGSRADQRLQILVGLADRVPEKCDRGGVPCNASEMLDDNGGVAGDRVGDFAAPFEAVHAAVSAVVAARTR